MPMHGSSSVSRRSVQQSVNVNDFLVCRGNGNVRLVGKGYFPDQSFSDVTFPDTIIAARINVQLIAREYLQFIWNSSAVRRQVEALARTTNGTFKVNQTMLESIQIVMPPLALQQTFATHPSHRSPKSHHRRPGRAGCAVRLCCSSVRFLGS